MNMSILQPEWNQQRQDIVNDRYSAQNESKWEEICQRLDNAVDTDVHDELLDFSFVPAGRILRGLGTDTTKTYFNCYFLKHRNLKKYNFSNLDSLKAQNLIKEDNIDFDDVPIQEYYGVDSRKSISDLEARALEISARGGGFGVNWSVLRPQNAYVDKVDGYSTGPVSFMKSLCPTIDTVKQGGSRRGAQMYGMEPWHPDIKDFIMVKRNQDVLNSANLSVFTSDRFMEAVKQDKDWDLVFPDTSWDKYDELWDGDIWKWRKKGYPIQKYDTVKAREIFNLIADGAHDNGEPGMIFLERANKLNIPNQDEQLQGSNPCGEEILPPDGVCNLGAINLTQFIDYDTNEILYDKLKNTIHKGIEFLDEIIDINPYYQKETKEQQQKFRKIGLGFMGLADYFILRGIKYGSDESLQEINNLLSFFQNSAFEKSAQLARKKGPAPVWKDYMLDNRYIQQLDDNVRKLIKAHGLRNTRLLTVAPTGTTSRLAGVSGGIEPNFAYELIRNDRMGKRESIHWLHSRKNELALEDELFIESSDLSYKEHINVQAEVQKYIDASISKTINADAKTTVEETKEAFLYAYNTGCKGITYYRAGSREGEVLSKKEREEKEKEVTELEKLFKESGREVIKREVPIPEEPPAKIIKRKDNQGKKWYFAIAFADRDKSRPFAFFIKTNNYAGTDVADWIISKMEKLLYDKGIDVELVNQQIKNYSGQSNIDKIGRTISMALRHNICIIDIVNLIDSCEPDFSSLLFHIKKVLERFIEDGTEIDEPCPECGGKLVYQEGCQNCLECGWSKCG